MLGFFCCCCESKYIQHLQGLHVFLGFLVNLKKSERKFRMLVIYISNSLLELNPFKFRIDVKLNKKLYDLVIKKEKKNASVQIYE